MIDKKKDYSSCIIFLSEKISTLVVINIKSNLLHVLISDYLNMSRLITSFTYF